MNEWKTVVRRLARDILGEDAPQARNLSRIESSIIPEQGKRERKTWSSETSSADDIEVLPEYDFIFQALHSGCPSLFVTGRAGTGKSTLIRWLIGKLEDVAVVAPTAIAAINVGGDTIHSFFHLSLAHIDPEAEFKIRPKARVVMENLRYLLIDEISMVLPNIVDAMNRILQQVRKSDQPFGGVPTVFIGDLLQLPPVVSSPEEQIYYSHYYKTQYFFSAKVFEVQEIIPVELKTVRRQSDGDFIESLSHIRVNQNHRQHVALFNRQCYRDKKYAVAESGVYLVPTNADAKARNSAELDKLETQLTRYDAVTTGSIAANRWRFPIPARLEVKIGARVIFLRNRKPKWINGDLGTIVGHDTDTVRIRKLDSRNVFVVGREKWEKYRYRYNYRTQKIEKEVIGTFQQFPVALGWAITIHKSQGMTLNNLTLDLAHGAFCEGQVYVALSRAREIGCLAHERSMESLW